MATRTQLRGICACCHLETTKGAMTRHLQKCPKREAAVEAANDGHEPGILLYLRV